MYVINVRLLMLGRRIIRYMGSLVVMRGSRLARAIWKEVFWEEGVGMDGNGSRSPEESLRSSAKADWSDVNELKAEITAGGRAGNFSLCICD